MVKFEIWRKEKNVKYFRIVNVTTLRPFVFAKNRRIDKNKKGRKEFRETRDWRCDNEFDLSRDDVFRVSTKSRSLVTRWSSFTAKKSARDTIALRFQPVRASFFPFFLLSLSLFLSRQGTRFDNITNPIQKRYVTIYGPCLKSNCGSILIRALRIFSKELGIYVPLPSE